MPTPSPTVKITVTEENDGLSFKLYDSTFTYHATYNTGGYNTPNIASSAVTQVLIKVYPPDYTTPYIYTFTILTNVVTAITVTSPAGVATVIATSRLTSTIWPFLQAHPFEALNTDLGFSEDDELTDGHWIIEYIISGPNDGTGVAFSVTASEDKLFNHQTCCCITKLFINLDPDCDCLEDKIKLATQAQAFLFDSGVSAEADLIAEAVTSLNKAKDICENQCQNC